MSAEYQVLITLIVCYVLLVAWFNLRTMIRLPTGDALPQPLPLVSVLLPARNEARNIGPCLASLLAQDYPNLEIFVLDDDSTDDTARIAQEYAARCARVRVISGQPLPAGWHGKAWACHQLAQEAKGEWLLFVDADTRHRPNAVSAALAAASARGLDLVSLLPDMALETFGLRVIMAIIPFVFVGCVPHIAFTRSRWPLLAGAIGPFMLFRREVYERLGGHEAVRADIVEDVFIARQVKRVGGRIALADGVDVLRVEFYRDFGEAWHGLSKSAFPALNYSLLALLVALAAFAAVFLGPYISLYNAWHTHRADLWHLGLPVLQIALTWLAMALIHRRFRIPPWYAPLSLLTILAAILFAMDSVANSLWGAGVEWKGRTYQFRAPAARR
jgi:chlorobactene glucosyltransferase